VGNYDSRELGALVSGALADNLLGRLAVQQYQSDGHIENSFLDRDDTAERDELTARAKLRWLDSDDLTIDATLFHVDGDNGYGNCSLYNQRNALSGEPGRDRQDTLALGVTASWRGSEVASLHTTVAVERSKLEYVFDEDWTNTTICEGLPCGSDLRGFDWWYSSADNYRRERGAV